MSYENKDVTTDEIKIWKKNKYVNPRTNRKIKESSKIYKYLENMSKKINNNKKNKSESNIDNVELKSLVKNSEKIIEDLRTKTNEDKILINKLNKEILVSSEKNTVSINELKNENENNKLIINNLNKTNKELQESLDNKNKLLEENNKKINKLKNELNELNQMNEMNKMNENDGITTLDQLTNNELNDETNNELNDELNNELNENGGNKLMLVFPIAVLCFGWLLTKMVF